jgi:hypothetical protein
MHGLYCQMSNKMDIKIYAYLKMLHELTQHATTFIQHLILLKEYNIEICQT